MDNIFKNNTSFVYIHTLGMKMDMKNARLKGIKKCLNSSTHIEYFGKDGEELWSDKVMKQPNNLMLNRLEGEVVISSLIFFSDAFCLNLFILRHLWHDGEDDPGVFQAGFLN